MSSCHWYHGIYNHESGSPSLTNDNLAPPDAPPGSNTCIGLVTIHDHATIILLIVGCALKKER